jgi:hypothetical protein
MPDAHAALDLALRSADPVMRRRRAATARARRSRDVFAGALARSWAPGHARIRLCPRRPARPASAPPLCPLATRGQVHRPHAALARRPPISRLALNNLPGTTPRSRPEPRQPEEPVARRSAPARSPLTEPATSGDADNSQRDPTVWSALTTRLLEASD